VWSQRSRVCGALAEHAPTAMSATVTRERTEPRKADARFGGGGRRLADAFDHVSALPALAEARMRLLDAASSPGASVTTLTEVVESDTALTIAVMRAANNGDGPSGRCESVPQAVESLTSDGIKGAVSGVGDYDVFSSPAGWTRRTESFRRHAIAVRLVADRVADLANVAPREHLAAAALLHDVGRLVLDELYGDLEEDLAPEATPEERVRAERRQFGIDHPLVGAVLARRWGLPPQVAAAIERHHAAEATDAAAAIKLADLVVHHANGTAIAPDAMRSAAAALDLSEERVRMLLYDFPPNGSRRRATEPCPLSAREIDALRGLAEGKVYKQIAQELTLSVSTIRTHLHNVYRKIGAVDRAQAVLIARDRGWL
jgi:putative nucleotidyltransferase with HDIG domain